MRILKTIFKSLLLLVVVLLAVSFVLPSTSEVSRTIEVEAPPEKVFTYLNNFEQFNRWSPWYGIDPNAQYQITGPEQGIGAKMSWTSDHSQVGSGSQEIIASEPGQRVVTRLEFAGQGGAEAAWDLNPTATGTQITWGFSTDWGYNPIGRYMGLMMDNMVGGQYEKGLASLKTLVEGE